MQKGTWSTNKVTGNISYHHYSLYMKGALVTPFHWFLFFGCGLSVSQLEQSSDYIFAGMVRVWVNLYHMVWQNILSAWANACEKLLLLQPSSAASDRLLICFVKFFQWYRQELYLRDYIHTSLVMIQEVIIIFYHWFFMRILENSLVPRPWPGDKANWERKVRKIGRHAGNISKTMGIKE